MRQTKLRKLARSESGASLVEFAILAPVLALLLIGLIDVGRYMYFGILAANAARAGAAYGAQNRSTGADSPNIKSYALSDAQNLAGWQTPTVASLCSVSGGALTTCPNPPPANTIYYVRVNVTGTFNTLIRYGIFPAQFTVSGSSTMRVASQ